MKSTDGIPIALGPQETQILEAFISFCFLHGIEEVTQQKIAKEAKIALATLQYYFGKGRPGLTESALQLVAKTGQDVTARLLLKEAEKKDYQPVQAYISVTFSWARKFPAHASFWLYSHYRSSIQSRYRELHSQFLATAKKRLTSLLYEQFGRKGQKPSSSVPDLADSIHGMLVGAIISGLIEKNPGALAHQRDLLLKNIETLLARSSANDHVRGSKRQ